MDDAQWKTPRSGPNLSRDTARLRAAMIQHACFVVMNGHIRDQRLTWRQVSQDIRSTGYAQLMRVVRGEAETSLTLLSELSHTFEPVLVYSDELRAVFKTDWPRVVGH